MLKFLCLSLLTVLSIAEDCPESGNCHHDAGFSWLDYTTSNEQGAESRAFMMEHKQSLIHEAPSPKRAATPCVDGFAGQYPCSGIDLISVISFPELCGDDCLGAQTGADIWGWTDPQDGVEYAIMTMATGTSFVRITDPENPEVLAFMPGTEGEASLWRDPKVMNNYAYIGSEKPGHGVQIFDLTRLRDMSAPRQIVSPDNTHTGMGNSHNLVMSEHSNTLFVVGATQAGYPNTCRGGLYGLDLTNPVDPEFVGCFGADDYVHDAQCVTYNGTDVPYQGREICFNYDEEHLVIADVTDKNNMIMLSRTAYDGNMYTHQGWIHDNHELLLMDDELDEFYNYGGSDTQRTHLWDIRSLQNPILVTTYYSGVRAIDHNQYIVGDYTFQANYESGLRVLEIDTVAPSLTEVAYFDVFTDPTTIDFFGMWSVYPYFASGNLICSTMEGEMFILRLNL